MIKSPSAPEVSSSAGRTRRSISTPHAWSLDLARRKYRVYLRGSDRGSHPNHVIMVRLDETGQLELYRTIHEQPATDKLLASYGRPNWWADLNTYLTLLAPELMNTSITTEEPCPTL